MNKKQAVIIASLLVLIVCAGVLATKVQSPLYLKTENTAATVDDRAETEDGSEYFEEAKLTRNAENDMTIENYKVMISNKNLSDESKKNYNEKLSALVMNANNQVKIEEELKLKGFKGVLCFIDNNKAKVVIKSEEKINDEESRKIQMVVLNISQIRDIEITNKQ